MLPTVRHKADPPGGLNATGFGKMKRIQPTARTLHFVLDPFAGYDVGSRHRFDRGRVSF